jgi:RNA polymerase sigma-70 factor (ECF subfamily)
MPTATIADAALVDLLMAQNSGLRALALRLLGDPGLVDDALQDAYIRASRALPRFRGDAALTTWLHRIVHNVCMDELRRRRHRAEQPYQEEGTTAPAMPADTGDATADFAAERADLAAGLAGLPAAHRAAIVLVDGYGMGYHAAATMLGVPTGTVGSRVFRARSVLRQTLAETAA